jgi:pyruvate dehydrogenase (quinone)
VAQNVGAYVLSRLKDWGIQRIYGYPGDGILGIMSGFQTVSGLEFVQVRHEEMAAFMACAHAKFTGEVGVCLATSGPGAIHLLNGLYDAKLDHQPVVAIVGQAQRASLGGHYQQEVDLLSLFKDVASEYVQVMTCPEQARHLVDRAVRIARAQRTVTCIIVPKDVQEEPIAQPRMEHGTVHSSTDYTTPRIVPKDDDLRRAADVLNAGQRVAMLVGQGALGASKQVMAVADLLGAGVAKALLGKAVIPDAVPFCTGSIGLLGTRPSWELMQNCDTLLMVGSNFPYSEFLPPLGKARGVQIDVDPRMLGLRYPMEVNLVGDARETLDALIPLLRKKTDREWQDELIDLNKIWWKQLEGRARAPADPLNPQLVFWELSPRLPDGCIITSDSGSCANWFARDLRIREGMACSLSGTLATMGPAVPYAFAAKMAFPERTLIALLGYGSIQMYCLF